MIGEKFATKVKKSVWQIHFILENEEVTDLLIRYRADVNHAIKGGTTSLHIAAINGIHSIISTKKIA